MSAQDHPAPCSHTWNSTKMLCTTCGALGRYAGLGNRIEAMKCDCGKDAIAYLEPGEFLCEAHYLLTARND